MSAVIYPVHLVVQGRHIWIGWKSSDDPGDALLKRHGTILWADTKAVLMEKSWAIQDSFFFEGEVVYDFDALLAKLVSREAVSCDEVINCWNLLIDIGGSLGAGFGSLHDVNDASFSNSYDRFFSATTGGGIVNFGFYDIEDMDLKNAVDVVSNGMAMLLNVVDARVGHKPSSWS
ncbi:hypothetical protein [Lysobacter capsici]|uniref:hypothetical protein n=1 Tax=Lysobacter capsici TaxID=435897 RepID=UPI00287BABD6|nr:hypothetical protein [Lysobacter capsici]WND81752.1 hypothetical protein RJ610_05135 [Lysobacter capsici]WND86948.1 hypothetical protein RJ609_05135 [Lysobacter capsici]